MLPRGQRRTTRLHPDQPNGILVNEPIETTEGIAAPAHARDDGIWQASGLIDDLLAGLAPDDRLKLPDHQRIRVRPEHRAQQVIGVTHTCDPVAHGLVDGVLERPAPRIHTGHGRTQEPHPEDVRLLPPHVLGTHEDLALETQQRAHRRCGHAVLSGAGFGDHPALSHPLGQQSLPERVVDLVRAGVRQVLALEK